MRHVRESEVEGERAPVPHSRTLKHLIAPWTVGSTRLWVGMSEVDQDSTSNRQAHANEECFYVVSGEGKIEVGEEEARVGPGSIVLVPADTEHRLINEGPDVLKVLCCAAPPFTRADFERRHLFRDSSLESVDGE